MHVAVSLNDEKWVSRIKACIFQMINVKNSQARLILSFQETASFLTIFKCDSLSNNTADSFVFMLDNIFMKNKTVSVCQILCFPESM